MQTATTAPSSSTMRSLPEDFSLVRIIQICWPWSVLLCWKSQICTKTVVSLLSMQSIFWLMLRLLSGTGQRAQGGEMQLEPEAGAVSNSCSTCGMDMISDQCTKAAILSWGERTNNQGHLAEIPESSSWAVENKQLFSHVLQHRFVFKRMLKSTLSQLSLHLPRVWWIFIWIHAKRGSLPLRAQKELEKNVFCLPSTQTTFYADWCTVL